MHSILMDHTPSACTGTDSTPLTPTVHSLRGTGPVPSHRVHTHAIIRSVCLAPPTLDPHIALLGRGVHRDLRAWRRGRRRHNACRLDHGLLDVSGRRLEWVCEGALALEAEGVEHLHVFVEGGIGRRKELSTFGEGWGGDTMSGGASGASRMCEKPCTCVQSWRQLVEGVVWPTLSPVKIELAPARNMTACSMGEKDMRPAERRTIERGMITRAVAIVRAIWKTSGDSPVSSICIGVPSIFTSALMGTCAQS